jgi:hypothetical protein
MLIFLAALPPVAEPFKKRGRQREGGCPAKAVKTPSLGHGIGDISKGIKGPERNQELWSGVHLMHSFDTEFFS